MGPESPYTAAHRHPVNPTRNGKLSSRQLQDKVLNLIRNPRNI